MKSSTFLGGAILFVCAVIAQAHTHLQQSTPADGAVLTASPSNIVLKFSEAARLTSAWIQKADEAKQKLGSIPEKPAADITIAIPALTPGTYVVGWRAAGDDGHIMPGQIHFTISPDGSRRIPGKQ